MNQPIEDNFVKKLYDSKWQDFLNRMEISFQSEHFFTHGWKNTGNKSINEVIPGLKNPGIGTDYSMAVIVFMSRNSVTKVVSQLTRPQPSRQTTEASSSNLSCAKWT